MDHPLEKEGQQRLEEYFERIAKVTGHDKRRAIFATSAVGVLNYGERKSMELVAARACADAARIDAEHGGWLTS